MALIKSAINQFSHFKSTLVTTKQKMKAFRDFPPLYLVLFMISAFFTVLWLLVFICRFGLIVIDLSATTPLVRFGWPVVLVQFLFSLLTFIGILKFALLRIDFQFYKEHTGKTIDFLREKLREYEPPEDEEYAD